MSSYVAARLVQGYVTAGRLARVGSPGGDARDRAGTGNNGGAGRTLRGRRETLEEQLEMVTVLLAGAMATGQTLVQALESCVTEVGGDPLGPEIRRVVDAYRVGTPVLTGLISMAGRLRHPDVDYLVRVIEIYLMSGGDLGNALGNVAATIRRRRSLRWEIRAGCAEARLSAVIMAACPFALTVFTAIMRPEMLRTLVGTPVGRIGLVYGLASWVAGLYLANRVTRVGDD
ncbi:MAG: type II secretion system F family protein [Ignavibacteriales bacterium]